MTVTYIGVRHHSPACSRLVAATIEAVRPAHVLIEGPSDLNPRLDELLLGHELPIAVYTYYRDDQRVHGSWTPFCDYSPEWVALTVGREHGAQVRFIDLPAWHPAFASRSNRYADADHRYEAVTERLCRDFAVDNADTLWDHLVEAVPDDDLAERLTTYFDVVRGESPAGEDDQAREEYMASWVRAAAAEGDVVVVTGGFHTPAIRALAVGTGDWPEVPAPPPDAVGDSYLVPYSHKRLDSFTGYQSGMPSPEYYQRLWTDGVAGAADAMVEAVVARLRGRKQPVSTADLIAARTLTTGLARLRGHEFPSRTDVLDGLVSALVHDDLPQPPPWSRRGPIAVGTHPAVVEMVAAFSGDRVGRLHEATPLPPLVVAVTGDLERLKLDHEGSVGLDLTVPLDLERSRTLHRLRVLGVPGFERLSGPSGGADPVLDERWQLTPSDHRLPALIEAGAYGATLPDSAAAAMRERIPGAGIADLAALLFDGALCGIDSWTPEIASSLAAGIARAGELDALGQVLATVLGLWRHDRLFGTAGSPVFAPMIVTAVQRSLWIMEGIRGGPAPAEPRRLRAVAACRDAVLHAGSALGLDRPSALAVAARVAANADAPPDLRGAACGFGWSLGDDVDAARAVAGVSTPRTLGDWLAGLFAVARDRVLSEERIVTVLDDIVSTMTEEDFLIALPALRQGFSFFPPSERETIARMLGGSRALLRADVDPLIVARAMALETTVDSVLAGQGLL
ncbi:DUF5682 family protein [Kutzneria sp. NPDC051319]|uniref:DUF5682 family protein n=1 Tax=Kutzneria sp. NPDC051319 TaxID=3155047 RepID=UPI00343A0CBE